MMALTPEDRLREASVVLADDEQEAWLEVIERSGRLKTPRADLLDRVRLAFGEHDLAASETLAHTLPKSGPKLPARADQLLAVLAGAQLVEMFGGPSGGRTDPSVIDAPALAVRILSRTSKSPVFPDLADHASAWLAMRGDAVRTGEPVILSTVRSTEVSLELDGQTIAQGDYEGLLVAHNTLTQQVMELGTSLANSRSDIKRLADTVEALGHARALLTEQQQIGWWVLSGPDPGPLDWRWAHASACALNELTRALPGPRAAPALIHHRAGHESWDPTPVLLDIAPAGDGRFSPALEMLRGEVSLLTEAHSAEEAAMAIYDELLFGRLMSR